GSILVQEREPKTTSSGATAPHTPPITAQTLTGEWLDRCPKRPPSRVIGHAAKEIKTHLSDGIHPDDIRRGLAHWLTKGPPPSTHRRPNPPRRMARPLPQTTPQPLHRTPR